MITTSSPPVYRSMQADKSSRNVINSRREIIPRSLYLAAHVNRICKLNQDVQASGADRPIFYRRIHRSDTTPFICTLSIYGDRGSRVLLRRGYIIYIYIHVFTNCTGNTWSLRVSTPTRKRSALNIIGRSREIARESSTGRRRDVERERKRECVATNPRSLLPPPPSLFSVWPDVSSFLPRCCDLPENIGTHSDN